MRGPKRLRVVLTERDERLIEALQDFRVVTREQAARIAGFGSVSRINARMLALVRAGHLTRRFSGQVGVGRKAVYGLPGAAKWNGSLLLHQLALNDVHLALLGSSDPRLLSWRRFMQPLTSDLPLIPDGLALLQVRGTPCPVFIEIDRGTESLAIIRQKAQAYFRLALSGEFASLSLGTQFRVAVIATSRRRARNLASTIALITHKLFFISDLESINRDGFFAPHWLRPGGTVAQPLF
jgi:hypothetical protein